MTKHHPPSQEANVECSLCYRIVPGAEIGLRGRLNFCRVCASQRSEECFVQLGKQRRRGGWLKPLVTTLCVLGLFCGVAYWIGTRYLAKDRPFLKLLSFWDGSESMPSEPAPAQERATTTVSGGASLYERIFGKKDQNSVQDVGSLHLLFVMGPGTDSRMGSSSRLFITREPPGEPNAKLMTNVGPEMKISFDEGFRYVRKQPRDWEKDFSIRLSFEDKFSSKDGGSAGTGFTLGMIAAIDGIAIDPDVAVTGDLTIDGSVQPVGAVVEKVRGAINGNCKLTLIPEQNSRDIVDLALLFGTSPLWETQVFSIGTIEQAMSLARKDRPAANRDAIARFAALRARLPATVTDNYLQSPIVQTELKEILKLAPNHLSAATLLRAAEYQLPKELSLNRSVEEILASSYIFVSEIIDSPSDNGQNKSSGGKGITIFPDREYNECVKYLQRITPILDHRSLDLKTSCLSYAGSLRALWNYQPADMRGRRTVQEWQTFTRRETDYVNETKEQLAASRSRILLALRKLATDGSMISEIRKK